MSKALDRLEHLRLGIQYINQDKSPAYISQYEEDIDIIETALKECEKMQEYGLDFLKELVKEPDDLKYKKLKAFEIIKEKHIDVDLFIDTISYGLETYNEVCCSWAELTQKDFDLLKEVLL